jgi:hypothetical protein
VDPRSGGFRRGEDNPLDCDRLVVDEDIDDVDPNAGEIVVTFDGRSITYGFGELDTLVPAYAAKYS